ncbi:MAG: hypothetical protein PHC64_01995 [Candidatus Gastranaerophilales bacterium]|nr:hypothetical protein [Candidatus Gastranaerophilales bacterium]
MGVNSPSAVPFTARTKEGNEYKKSNTFTVLWGATDAALATTAISLKNTNAYYDFWNRIAERIPRRSIEQITTLEKVAAGGALVAGFAILGALGGKIIDGIINHFRAKGVDKKIAEQNTQVPRTVAIG